MGEGRWWHRYVCPFSRCGGGTLTAWGIKRHVTRHMDAIHASLEVPPGEWKG